MKLSTTLAIVILANGASAFVPRTPHQSSLPPALFMVRGKSKMAKEKKANSPPIATQQAPAAVAEPVGQADHGAATAEADDALQVSAAKAAIAATQKKNELTARSMLATRFEMEEKAREAKAREASLALEAQKAAEEREEALAQEAKARAEALALEDAARKAAEKAAADATISATKKKQELTARSLLADRFAREEKVRAAERERLAAIAAKQGQIDAMRTWPKSDEEEAALAAKYAAMDLEEKCFNILLDLGMIKLHPDEEGTPEFDGSGPEDYVYE